MKRLNVAMTAVAVLCVAVLAACSADHSTDEAAIRETNKKWLEAIVAKDAKTIAGIYAEDGEMMPPNGPKLVGRAAVEQGWAGFMSAPGMTLTFETQKFVFAKSSDVAIDIGSYKSSIGGVADEGKFVVTWVKRDGKWYVQTDMFSSDLPAGGAPEPKGDAASGTVPEGAPQPSPEEAPYSTGPAPSAPPASVPATPAPAPAESAPAPATPN